jgi:hypothetical protein
VGLNGYDSVLCLAVNAIVVNASCRKGGADGDQPQAAVDQAALLGTERKTDVGMLFYVLIVPLSRQIRTEYGANATGGDSALVHKMAKGSEPSGSVYQTLTGCQPGKTGIFTHQ